ncbi:MAG TPA: ABC transporter permease, partial [Bacteroidota bacterium]
MFVNYLKIALRNLRWKKGYTAINLVGLATGIALCLVMMLYVLHEFSFDRFHERGDRIYRVIYNPAWTAGAAREPSVYTPTILAPLFRRQIPEVESAVRFFDSFGSVLVSTDDKVFEEERFFYADSTVFNIFSLQLLVGSNTNALTRPRCVVVTQSIARKYFGDANPIGKMLTLNNRTAYEVTGIMADVPFNSHLQFDFLASFSSLDQWANREIWSEANFYTYLLLREGAEVQNIQAITEAVIRNAIRSSAVSTSFDAGVILEP